LIEYAVEAPCIMGRLPSEARTPYRGYARNIGLAFQIADDLIDHAPHAEPRAFEFQLPARSRPSMTALILSTSNTSKYRISPRACPAHCLYKRTSFS
ncbi:MAG: hypothetical protein AAB092_06830, partial [Chloroflexota bacterium]